MGALTIRIEFWGSYIVYFHRDHKRILVLIIPIPTLRYFKNPSKTNNKYSYL